MRFHTFLLLFLYPILADCQSVLSGRVTDSRDGTPLAGAVVKVAGSTSGTICDEEGQYQLPAPHSPATLIFSFIGYKSHEVEASPKIFLEIAMEPDENYLETVTISTGYEKIDIQKATGSFSLVNQELINRRIGAGIMERLEDVVPGLIFNKGTGAAGRLTIRGQNTINSSSAPLIVIDNFPFEGDISSINPNDVETISVLRDASASSIWGARAGNGVIVITTKKGGFEQPAEITFSANHTLSAKPDLFYQPVMTPGEFIDNEIRMFADGLYTNAESHSSKRPFTPVIETLIARRNGTISEPEAQNYLNSLRSYDLREDLGRYLYRNASNQQYNINIRGGGKNNRYAVSLGYDQNKANEQGNDYRRYTLSLNDSYLVAKGKLELSMGIYLSGALTTNNHPGRLSVTNTISGSTGTPLYPYARLADSQGNALAVINRYRISELEKATQNGLLDWQYRPLDELNLNPDKNRLTNARIDIGLLYNLLPGITIKALYQYGNERLVGEKTYDPESYFVRDLINQFSSVDPDGSIRRPVPPGGIKDTRQSLLTSHSARLQANFDKQLGHSGNMVLIAGTELRDNKGNGNTQRLYGYNDELGLNSPVDYNGFYSSYLIPSSTTNRIPFLDAVTGTTDRYLSYFANGAYTWRKKYTLSASGRIDQSNLFGVKTNQKGIPLYSAGIAWHLHKERFYSIDWLPYLKLRLTYGSSGNSNNNVSSLITASYAAADAYTGQRYARISNPPNPGLRWEKIKTINLGLDFTFSRGILNGSLEYYSKKGEDLIGTLPYPGSSGIKRFTGNYASTSGNGVDLVLNGKPIGKQIKWSPHLLLSHSRDKVTRYDVKGTPTAYLTTGDGLSTVPLTGRPLYAIYSVPWAGLEPETGDPQGYLEGQVSKDYVRIITGKSPEELTYHGPARPVWFGAFRNHVSWKGFSLSANISYRFGHYFRASSVNYSSDLLLGRPTHADYSKRWQKPGDELKTHVPSRPERTISGRDAFYAQSDIHVQKSDHIRLTDLNLTYDWKKVSWLSARNIQTYLYANRIGTLWKATRLNLDPDFFNADYIPPFTLALGLKVGF